MSNNERQFEDDVFALMTEKLGWTARKNADFTRTVDKAMDLPVFVKFLKTSQPKAWARFEAACEGEDAVETLYTKFENAVGTDGIVAVLKDGFRAKGVKFAAYFPKPENGLCDSGVEDYGKNICHIVRQWHYSPHEPAKSVDLMLAVNGIPLCAIELKDPFTGQTVAQAKTQWMTDRNPKEDVFRLNHRCIVFFAVDLNAVEMTTKLADLETEFLPFNQGSAGAGNDGGKGNPPADPSWTDGPRAPTDYLWRDVLQKDSFLDIIQKFVNFDAKKKRLLFPRFHQLDVVRKLIGDVSRNGPGKNYLVQHSAGSGKSNSIAWVAYRLASLFNAEDKPMFNSVIIVTDRRVLDKQLQETVNSFNPKLGEVAVIDEKKHAKDLKQAIEDGRRIIVSTLQKFPVIFKDIKKVEGKKFAIIVDEAHSSQTGDSAAKLKVALADLKDAIREYEAATGKKVDKNDLESPDTQLALLMCSKGKHTNLSYFAFTATPKDVTLNIFGTRHGRSFRPFHIYSMRQAIEEEFIHDVLLYYTTYKMCTEIVKARPDNPEVPVTEAAKTISRYMRLHPKNFFEKSEVIADTFLSVTEGKIGGKGKMMVVADSRLAAVRYFFALRDAFKTRKREDVKVMIAFSGTVHDPATNLDHTESSLNVDAKGRHIAESQTKDVFHAEGRVLVVADKYQTGFDETLLHTMIVDKKLRDLKAVQTLSRVNRKETGKVDTYILDFVNKAAEIKEAFQPYYQETDLGEQIDIDRVFRRLKEIQEYRLYSQADVDAVSKIHFSSAKRDQASVQGQIAGALGPVAAKYNQLDKKERALYRRQVRSFVRWYNYLSQITRLFDEETEREHVFLAYLERLLPSDPVEHFDLENSVKLTYYKLKETFAGSISLDKTKTVLPKPDIRPVLPMTQKKDLLQRVIDAINSEYAGEFSDKDRVIVELILPILCKNPNLKRAARSQDENVYVTSAFPNEVDKAIMAAYEENDKAFAALLKNEEKYKVFRRVLAQLTYHELRKSEAKRPAFAYPEETGDAGYAMAAEPEGPQYEVGKRRGK